MEILSTNSPHGTLALVLVVVAAALVGLAAWRAADARSLARVWREKIEAGNFFGTDDYFPFFKARVDELRFVDRPGGD